MGWGADGPRRTCRECGRTFPETCEWFHRDRAKVRGLRANCKWCQQAATRVYRAGLDAGTLPEHADPRVRARRARRAEKLERARRAGPPARGLAPTGDYAPTWADRLGS